MVLSKVPVKEVISAILIIAGIYCLWMFFTAPIEGKGKIDHTILMPQHITSATYKIYGNEKLGFWAAKMIIKNSGSAPLYNVRVEYKLEEYSDWSEGKEYSILLPNSTVVDLYYPLISGDITKLTTSKTSKINFKITYSEKPDDPEKEITEGKSIMLLGANDFIFTSISPEKNTGTFYDNFDNYPLIAAWVTPTDPVVREYADLGNKLAGGAGASLSDEGAIASLRGMWDISVLNNIQYKTEPAAFWTGKMSQYLKYPRDVIRDKAGTCIDTAIFFSSLAIAQGLKAYIILMPGHAFPVIQLPSGIWIPIESTMLNSQASFEEAVAGGEQSYQQAQTGPYIIIDVQALQAAGVTPPELETLPTDILDKWGIKEGRVTSDPGNTGTLKGQRFVHQSDPLWSIIPPQGWTYDQTSANEVDFYSNPTDQVEYIIVWAQGKTVSQARKDTENILNMGGFYKVEEQQVAVSGVSAQAVLYQGYLDGMAYETIVWYFASNNYVFGILCDYPTAMDELSTCMQLTDTFKLGG
ncbi:MAG: cysteine protease [Candidatus Micrarchaeota archaeon]